MSSNTEVINIPPGFTVESFEEAQELATKLRIVAGAILALFVWDHILLMPTEWRLYRNATKSMLKSAPFWSFVLLRYSPYLASITSIIFSSTSIPNCAAAAHISFVGVLLTHVGSGLIFTARVFALLSTPGERHFSFRPSLNVVFCNLVAILYVCNIAAWIAVLPGYSFTTGPPVRFGSNCLNPQTYSWSALSYGTASLFDTSVLLCTLYAHRRSVLLAGGKTTGIMSRVYKDGLIYFAFVTVANIVAFGMNLAPPDKAYYKSFATPFSTFAVVTCGERVFLNLRLMGIQLNKSTYLSDPAHMGSLPGAKPGSRRPSAQPNWGNAKAQSYVPPMNRRSLVDGPDSMPLTPSGFALNPAIKGSSPFSMEHSRHSSVGKLDTDPERMDLDLQRSNGQSTREEDDDEKMVYVMQSRRNFSHTTQDSTPLSGTGFNIPLRSVQVHRDETP